MAGDADNQGGDAAGHSLAQLRTVAAVDQPRRQVPQQVDDLGTGGALDHLGDTGPDPGQLGHRHEEVE